MLLQFGSENAMSALTSSVSQPEASSDELPSALLREQERFEWFADRLEPWLEYYSLDQLRDFLQSDPFRPGQRKKAMVLLALSDNPEAVEELRDFDSSDEGEGFRLLHQVSLHRAKERHGALSQSSGRQ